MSAGDRGRLPWRAGGLRRLAAAAPGNIALAGLSLAMAVVLWAVVTNSENPVERRTVETRVQVNGVPRDYLVAGVSPERVLVAVTGPLRDLRELRPELVLARADISQHGQAGEGQQEYTVDARVEVDVPRGLRGEPVVESVKVTLEHVERREFKVQVKPTGALPQGYEVEGIIVDRTDVLVSGTRRSVGDVQAVFADVNLDGQTVTFSRTVPLEARDRDGRTVGNVRLEPATVGVTVRIKRNLYTKDVVVNVRFRGRPKTGYTVTSLLADPPVVAVVGPLTEINQLAGVSTEPVDIEGAAADVLRPVRLQLPPNVTTSQPTVVAQVGIRAERAPGSVAVVPRVINLAPGLTAQLSTPVVAVNVSGLLADVVQIKATDITVVLDAAGLSPGTHRLEPRVTLPPTLQLEGVVPERVELTIAPAR